MALKFGLFAPEATWQRILSISKFSMNLVNVHIDGLKYLVRKKTFAQVCKQDIALLLNKGVANNMQQLSQVVGSCLLAGEIWTTGELSCRCYVRKFS